MPDSKNGTSTTSRQKFRRHPELQKGIRIQYIDENGATRTERIHSRHGNTITVVDVLKRKKRIKIEHIEGYWKPRVKASPDNLILHQKQP